MMMADTRGVMPDPPMSRMEVRLARVERAVPLDAAVRSMAGRYADTCMDFLTTEAGPAKERLRRRSAWQYRAFQRLLDALTQLALQTDADLQRSVTRS
jgi:hypothetical protein